MDIPSQCVLRGSLKEPSTPVPELDKALKKHLSHCFVHYLITGLIQGFLAGLTLLPKTSLICNNL